MHCATLAGSLLRGVWGMYLGGCALQGGWFWEFPISLLQVAVEMRHGIGVCHPGPVVVEISIVICFESGVVMCIVNLCDGDLVLRRVLKAFVC